MNACATNFAAARTRCRDSGNAARTLTRKDGSPLLPDPLPPRPRGYALWGTDPARSGHMPPKTRESTDECRGLGRARPARRR
jgi:hypothetical protein